MSLNKRLWSLVVFVLLVLSLLRFALWNNSSTYDYFIKHVSIDEIGFRLRVALYTEKLVTAKIRASQPVTPIGSSQVFNIFMNAPDLIPFDFPGVTTFEYPYLADAFIKRFNTRHVILFLSDIDLYFVNHPGTICDLPSRSMNDTVALLEKFIEVGGIQRFDNYYWNAWACNYLPEYRFASVTRTLAFRSLSTLSASSFSSTYFPGKKKYSYVDHEQRHPQNDHISLKTRLKFNLDGLERFLQKMEREGLEVHIFQGVYNTDKIKLKGDPDYVPSNKILQELASKFNYVSYVDLNFQVPNSDFVDEFHLKPSRAQKILEIFRNYITSQGFN
jgi:hypothetical protein